MALVIAVALAIAQVMNVFLLLSEQQLHQLTRRTGLAESFCGEAIVDLFSSSQEQSAARVRGMSNNPLMSLELVAPSLRGVQDLVRDFPLEQRVKEDLARKGIFITAIEAGARPVLHRLATRDQRGNLPPPTGTMEPPPPGQRQPPPPETPPAGLREPPPSDAAPLETFIAVRQYPRGDWLRCRVVSPPEDPSINRRLILSTLALYLIVLSSLLLLTRWLAAPLSRLAEAASEMGSGERVSPLPIDGPQEVSEVAKAFNDMNGRITSMLMDKDAMLGAIGHDLRTPLTSLRIRAENLEPSRDRDRMIDSIEHLTRMLDGILELSKIGGNKEAAVLTDLTALIMTIVDDFEDLGLDVRLKSTERNQSTLRPHLFMRLLRNLIENAVKYGERARLSVDAVPGELLIHVDDDGPGLAAGMIDRLIKPFERLDMSRNSISGGAGLGLSIAKMIADAHGASLQFQNRRDGGLRVTIRLPQHFAGT
jgi:signal transduction histidine kinase